MFDMRPYNRKDAMEGYDLSRDIRNFEKDFFSFPFLSFEKGMLSEFKTDIVDNGDEYVLEADLPGFDKKRHPARYRQQRADHSGRAAFGA